MNRKALIPGLTTIVIWSSGFAGISASLQGGFTSGHLVLFRFIVASLTLLILAFLSRNSFRLPDKKDIIRIVILGWIGITIYHLGITFGQQTVTAGTAGMVIGASPIFTTLIAIWFLKERLDWFGWIGLFGGFIGLFLITLGTSGDGFSFSGGIGLIFIAAIATSIFFVFQKPLLIKYRPLELTAYFTWAGTLPMFVFFPGLIENIQTATIQANLSAIYVGVFPAAIAYITWSSTLALGDASKISSLMYLEPVLAIFIAWIWLNELPNLLSLIGGTIAITSVFTVNYIGERKRRKELYR